MNRILRTIVLILGITSLALCGPGGPIPMAPEIDPGSAMSAVALVSAGLLMLSRRRKQR